MEEARFDQTGSTPTPQPAPSPLVAPAEPERPQWRAAAIVAGLVLVLAFGSWIGYVSITKRLSAARQLDHATTLLEKADATVLDIDEVVRAEVDAKLADKARGLIGKIDDAAADLNEAADLVSKAQPGLNDVDRKRAKATKAAIDERLTMLGVANAILDANAKAGVALDPATKGWDTMLEGERLADAAVVEYNKLTKAGVSASTSLTADAEAKIRAGRALMSEAATAFPEAGLKLYVEYADGKLALLATSKKSNAAWLLGDITSANKLISQYNADEKTVIVIAKRLPESPARAVADAYQKLAGAATDTYFEARERATKADATLKDM